jgi:MoaA/NifB/PqqE/SkfB family radical SAM enzyme
VSATILLLHGYSGSPDDLMPLAATLGHALGAGCVTRLRLPGHERGQVPAFDAQAFVNSVREDIAAGARQGKKLIVLGHSTGGSLLLAAFAESGIRPDLLVLASVPKRIDAAYLERWNEHRAGRTELPFASVANMISLINAAGSIRFESKFPVILIQGVRDELVPPDTPAQWETEGSFAGPVRTILIPGGIHQLFKGPSSAIAIDALLRAVGDSLHNPSHEEKRIVEKIASSEAEVNVFLGRSAFSIRHLAASPAGRAAAGREPVLSPIVSTEPVIANIEVTTRCNLKCTYCARTVRGSEAGDMSRDLFRTVLGLLPHAYRITLVGLGETLMHPYVVDLVAHAASQGRRVALVTNGMLLDEGLSLELLKAGLESIAFSLDGATQQTASEVRLGTDLDRVTGNIRKFVELSRSIRPISTAVFSAISAMTVSSLPRLVELVSDLGVHVMMLSDLNFKENLGRTVWKNATPETAAQVRASVATAFRRRLPVLSVRGLEELGLGTRYDQFLLLPPDQLFLRSRQRTWCCSPWQTVPVNVRGEVTLCDCQPDLAAGNLLEKPLPAIWNGDVFVNYRERMLSSEPPEACRICPRF